MTTIVFTTTDADAMAKQCAIFLREYCTQHGDNCEGCALNTGSDSFHFCMCFGLDTPEQWEVSNES